MGELLDFFRLLLTDPGALVGKIACMVLGGFASFFPSTPQQFTLAGVANQIGQNLPFLGSGVIFGVFRDFGLILSLVLVIKIYKLIPFKMT